MTDYAIIGGGRLARHFSEYFRLLDIPHVRWARDSRAAHNSFEIPAAGQRLRSAVESARRVLILVSDDAIITLLKQYPFLHEKQLIHCSGALSFPGVAGAHPLMTFADQLYPLEVYRSVPFMVEAGYSFDRLFPGLDNPNHSIDVQDKALYHALCVMAGNFSQLLWKGVAGRFSDRIDLPAETLHPYLRQALANFIRSPEAALTGPSVRNDIRTVGRNLQALENDSMGGLYKAFIDYYHSGEANGKPGERTAREQVQ